MLMLANTIDAVVGGDTHRDSHALEIASPTGAPNATLEIDNDDLGFSRALAWIVTHAPGPNIVVALEGTRSYGIGLARALQAERLAGDRGCPTPARGPPPRQVRPHRRPPGRPTRLTHAGRPAAHPTRGRRPG